MSRIVPTRDEPEREKLWGKEVYSVGAWTIPPMLLLAAPQLPKGPTANTNSYGADRIAALLWYRPLCGFDLGGSFGLARPAKWTPHNLADERYCPIISFNHDVLTRVMVCSLGIFKNALDIP